MSGRRRAVLVLVLAAAIATGWVAWRALRTASAPPPLATPALADVGPSSAPDDAASERAAILDPAAPAPADPSVGELRLRVLWYDGSPAAGVAIEVLPLDAPQPWHEVRWRRADERGEVVLERLPAGRASVRALRVERFVMDMGGDGNVEPRAHRVDVAGGGTTSAEVRVARGIDLTLRVVDAGGDPAPLARILAGAGRVPGRIPAVEVARADEHGMVHVRSVHERYSIVAVTDDGRSSAPELARDLAARGGAGSADVTLSLAGASLSGRVLAGDSTPLANARVRVEIAPKERRTNAPLDVATTTDSAGRWSIAGLAPGRATVVVDAPRLAPWTTVVSLAAGRDERVRTVLDDGFVLRGRVGSARGEAVSNARVDAPEIAGGSNAFGWWGYYQVQVDAARGGAYALRWLPAGSVAVRAQATIGGGRAEAAHSIVGESGSTLEWNPLLATPARITGRAVDDRGTPVHGWVVRAQASHDSAIVETSTRTAADGSFALEGLEERAYDVFLDGPPPPSDVPWGTSRWRAAVREVMPNGPPLLLAAAGEHELAFVTGLLVRTDGEPVREPHLSVTARMRDVNVLQPVVRWDESRFRIGPLDPGEWRIDLVDAALGYAALGSFELAPGQERDLGTVTLGPPVKLEVELVSRDGIALRGAMVSISPRGSNAVMAPSLNERDIASFVFEALQPGDYELLGMARNAQLTLERIELRPREPRAITMTLAPGVACGLHLHPPSGQRPIWTRAEIELQAAEGDEWLRIPGGYWNATHSSYGTVTFLGPGTWRWRARAGPNLAGEGEIVVPAASGELTFDLPLALE